MISLYFGLPRCGKTTFACALALHNVKKRKVYCNFPCLVRGVTVVPNSAIGRFDMSDSLIIIDEASLYADSRAYKGFPKELVSFFCLHGHWHCDIVLFCQIYNRVDATIRQLCERVYYMRKNPIFRGITSVYRVPYGIAFTPPPNSEGKNKYGDINEGYKEPSFWGRVFAKRIIRRKYYKYFDTHWKPYELPPLDLADARA